MHDEINNYEGRTVEDARMLIENGDTGKWHTDANCLAHLPSFTEYKNSVNSMIREANWRPVTR